MPVFVHTVQTVPTRALLASRKRRSFTVQNTSAQDVFYAKNRNVSINGFTSGHKISASGGLLTDEFHKGEVWLIAAAQVDVTVSEDLEGE